jgi:hypothetical protein
MSSWYLKSELGTGLGVFSFTDGYRRMIQIPGWSCYQDVGTFSCNDLGGYSRTRIITRHNERPEFQALLAEAQKGTLLVGVSRLESPRAIGCSLYHWKNRPQISHSMRRFEIERV